MKTQEDSLLVAEKFLSIQGEGKNSGIPLIFIRLTACNLFCEGAGWRCDTIEVWQKGVSMKFEEILEPDWIQKLKEKKCGLIFTGGEPILQQDRIVKFYDWLKATHQIEPYVEMETNGTKLPSNELIALIDHWNCSPKLSDSGNKKSRRFKPEDIRTIAKQKSASFKFVFSAQSDLTEIEEYIALGIRQDQVMLMPAGASTDELDQIRQKVVEICLDRGWRYTDRLQIVIWEQATGV